MPSFANLERSNDERLAALETAKASRQARMQAKLRLKSGDMTLDEFFELADSDEQIGRMKVDQMLKAVPGVGVVKCRRIMSEVGIAETRRVAGLGKRQRKQLIEILSK